MAVRVVAQGSMGKTPGRRRADRVLGLTGNTALTLIVALGAIFMVMPFIWMVVTAQKNLPEVSRVPVTWFPDNWLNWNNYRLLLTKWPALRWMLNSIIVSTVSITTSVFFAALAGYAFAKLRFRGREICFAIVLSVMMIPFEVTFLPLFVMLSRVGLVNTYAGIIFPDFMSVIGVFIMRQFMQSIPNDYIDAARIDGASEIQIVARVVAPLAGSAIVTVAVLKFIISWNAFLWPLVMATSKYMMTMPVGMQSVINQFIIEYGMLAAGATLMVLPPLILFLVAQRWVISGMVMSGLKG
ncbi:MAG: carbohydrate ABC transporter permease [Chloroflexi bacterium]|nr:carbohydrate ABC transporter permease [Chloroflexota bacterium]